MPLRAILTPNAVLLDVAVEHKKQLLQELAKVLAQQAKLAEHDVFDVLWEREKLGTTGVGHGIAIPHGKLDGLDKVYGLFVRLKHPLDYEAIDEQPVDLVFALVAPIDAGADHLKALAQISTLLRDQQVCQQLRAGKNPQAVHDIMVGASARHAA